MQKGKTMHRALPLRPGRLPGAALVFAAASIVCGNALAVRIGDGPRGPSGHLDPFLPLVAGRYALCYSSGREPYGIEGLRAYRLLLGARTERLALWVEWDVIAHTLYRLDELRLRMGVGPFLLPLSIVLEPVVRRESVRGFPAGYSAGLAAVLVARRAGVGCSLKREISGWGGACPILAECRVGLDRLSFTTAVYLQDGGIDLRELEGEFSIEGVATLRTGYRFYTGEVLCGIGCRRRGILFTALWEHHPVLGRTVSIGMGYVWAR